MQFLPTTSSFGHELFREPHAPERQFKDRDHALMRIRFKRKKSSAFVLVATVAALLTARANSEIWVNKAHCTVDGSAIRPVEWRQWVHVGTRYKPIGLNILDQKLTKTPEILNAYVEPSALAAFQRTGRWPEGAQIIKEFSAIRVGPGCDPMTFVCHSRFGDGIYESGYMGLGYMVKDSARFPNQPGNWGYFSFGHRPPPYLPVARPTTTCISCHIRLASDTDYVISAAHLGLASPGR
jgi:Cytochrome P460